MNDSLIQLFCIFQFVNIGIALTELDTIAKEWKGLTIDKKIGRTFFFFIPSLVILSLLYRPL